MSGEALLSWEEAIALVLASREQPTLRLLEQLPVWALRHPQLPVVMRDLEASGAALRDDTGAMIVERLREHDRAVRAGA